MSRSPTTRTAAAGSALGPPAVTALLLAFGYRLVPLGGLRGVAPVALYVVALAALGATVAVASQLDLHASVAVAVVAVVAAASQGLFGPGPDGGDVLSFVAAALFLAAAVPVVAAGEFAWRYPEATRRTVPPRTARTAAAVGVAHLAAWVALRSVALDGLRWRLALLSLGLWVWVGIGGLALGAVPVVLWRQRGLVAPGVVVAGAFAFAAGTTLAGPTPGAGGAAASALTLYGVGWFVPLAVALGAGAAEHAVRARLG